MKFDLFVLAYVGWPFLVLAVAGVVYREYELAAAMCFGMVMLLLFYLLVRCPADTPPSDGSTGGAVDRGHGDVAETGCRVDAYRVSCGGCLQPRGLWRWQVSVGGNRAVLCLTCLRRFADDLARTVARATAHEADSDDD